MRPTPVRRCSCPVVLFLIPLNEIVAKNIKDLLYEPSLMGTFVYAGLAVWMLGFLVMRRADSGD